MKSTIALLSFCLLFSGTFLFAQAPTVHAPAKDHLLEINAQWAKHIEAAPLESKSFQTDAERIQYHLEVVIKYLANNPPQGLSKEALSKREALLNQLEGYAKAQKFPKNIFHDKRQPYFVDHEGTHCAVAYLMKESGATALVQEVSRTYNFDYLLDMPKADLLNWGSENGFTLNELALIQPGYPPQTAYEPVGEGTNGPVYKMISNDLYGVVFTGDFTELDGNACQGIGLYKDDQLTCLADGIEGQINDIAFDYVTNQTQLIVAGALDYNGMTYPVAIYEDGAWIFIDIPDRPNAVGHLIDRYVPSSEGRFSIIISDGPNTDQTELWLLDSDDSWQQTASFNGIVMDVHRSQSKRFYAGHFTEMTSLDNGNSTTIPALNIIYIDDFELIWHGNTAEVSDTVRTIESYGSAVYFGGTCHQEAGPGAVCLTRFQGGTFQTILDRGYFTSTPTSYIDAILPKEENLIIGGAFEYIPFLGLYGFNLGLYNLTTNNADALGVLDGPVHCIASYKNEVYFGGAFTENMVIEQPLPFLAKIDEDPNSIWEQPNEDGLILFPNPAQTECTIDGMKAPFNYSIFDTTGKLVHAGIAQENTIPLGMIPTGLYIISVQSNKRKHDFKLVKQ